jgi:hypothetical protein
VDVWLTLNVSENKHYGITFFCSIYHCVEPGRVSRGLFGCRLKGAKRKEKVSKKVSREPCPISRFQLIFCINTLTPAAVHFFKSAASITIRQYFFLFFTLRPRFRLRPDQMILLLSLPFRLRPDEENVVDSLGQIINYCSIQLDSALSPLR